MSTRNRGQPENTLPEVATPQEVLVTLTQILRGTMTETSTRKASGGEESVQIPPKISERSKAAEMLGKRYGLFTDKDHSTQPREEVVRELEAALKKLTEDARGSFGA